MAWTSPPTYTDGQIIAAADLDIISNNFNEVALHDHSGGSGSGTRSLGGSATGLISVYMRDGAGPGTPTGTISAVFTTGSRLAMHSSGGTVVLFATSGHEHGITQVQNVNEMPVGATSHDIGAVDFWIATIATGASASLATATLSTAIAIGGTGKRSVAVNAGYCVMSTAGASATFQLVLYRDGASFAVASFLWAPQVVRLITIGTIDPTLASGSYTYAVTIRRQAGGTEGYSLPGAFISVREVSVP